MVGREGDYVTYLTRKTDHHWTLFNDHQVQEVPEELVCNQEATLLIYSRLRELRPDRTETGSSVKRETPSEHEDTDTLPTDRVEDVLAARQVYHYEGPAQSLVARLEEHEAWDVGKVWRELNLDTVQTPEGGSNTGSAQGPQEQGQGKKVMVNQVYLCEQEDVPNRNQSPPQRTLFKGAETAANRRKGQQQLCTALRRKLSSNSWTSLETIMGWLSGKNRFKPCRLLAALDVEKIQEWIGPRHNLASFVQGCPFVISRKNGDSLEFSLREPSPTLDTTPQSSQTPDKEVAQPQSDPPLRQVIPPPFGARRGGPFSAPLQGVTRPTSRGKTQSLRGPNW